MKVLAVLIATLALASPAAAAPFLQSKPLERAASYVAGKPVRVMCATSNSAWRAYVTAAEGSSVESNGTTVPGSNVTHLDYIVCSALAYQLAGSAVADATLGPSIEVLTHESIHARGESDEGVTDCAAMHEMPGVAVRFFRVKPGKQLRALMATTWAWHRTAPSAAYRTVC